MWGVYSLSCSGRTAHLFSASNQGQHEPFSLIVSAKPVLVQCSLKQPHTKYPLHHSKIHSVFVAAVFPAIIGLLAVGLSMLIIGGRKDAYIRRTKQYEN